MQLEAFQPSSRSIRRTAKKRLQKEDREFAARPQIQVTKLDRLLDSEDDLPLYQRELAISRKVTAYARILRESYQLFLKTGVTEETFRRRLLTAIPDYNEYDRLETETRFGQEIHPSKLRQIVPRLKSLESERMRLNIKAPFIGGDRDAAIALLSDRNIPLQSLFDEDYRASREQTELLRMHVEWLTNEERKKRKQKIDEQKRAQEQKKYILNPQHVSDQEEQSEPIFINKTNQPDTLPNPTAPTYELSSWDLFWTTVRYSRDPKRFLPIPTDSREVAIQRFAQIGRGEITIKPQSVIRALEFYLSKDVIQRALTARLKYGPEDMRDWIKIKRGSNRILLLIQEPNTAIFFAGDRQSIYE